MGSHRAKASQHGAQQSGEVPSPGVPEGLLGESPTTTVTLDGVRCMALLDTGSQVTRLSNKFYMSHLSHRQLKWSGWL